MLAAGALTCVQTSPAAGQGVTGPAAHPPGEIQLVVMPPETTIGDLASVPGVSVGVMSTGIGSVPPEQTYLDVSQGNRIDDALYDQPLPSLRSAFLRVPRWSQVVQRADAAPAEIVPGLLGSTLLDAGIRPEPVPTAGVAAITVADRSGEIGRVVGGPVGVGVFSAGVGTVRRQARALPGGGLMIAFAEPSPGREVVPIGIVGTGFQRRSLTSDSTRTDGYVLSTDIAPTILRQLGLPIPDEMDGEEIRSGGAASPAAVSELVDRMAAIPDRREPILVACILAWLLVGFAVSRLVVGLRRVAMAWLGLCFAYMPLMLLVGAWLEPGAVAEGLLVGFGAAVLAALTVRLARGWRGLAIASAITVIAYAIDVIAGSGLTRLSLLGPNPIFGARFYGIGNELEALFAVMVPMGVATGLTAYSDRGRGVSRRTGIAAFLVAGAAGAIVFGAGRFGADVGAAIVLPVGAAVAAASLAVAQDHEHFPGSPPRKCSRLRWGAALVAAPLAGLVLLAFIDLVSGGNSHLTRSAFDAGGAGDLADIAERRLRLSAHDFGQAAGNPLFWVVVVGIGAAIAQRRRIDTWLQPAPMARAGLIGACAAVAVGVIVNDSGATFLTLGALALGVFLAFAWSQRPNSVVRRVIAEREPGR
jgi:hypothetical protein